MYIILLFCTNAAVEKDPCCDVTLLTQNKNTAVGSILCYLLPSNRLPPPLTLSLPYEGCWCWVQIVGADFRLQALPPQLLTSWPSRPSSFSSWLLSGWLKSPGESAIKKFYVNHCCECPLPCHVEEVHWIFCLFFLSSVFYGFWNAICN